MKKTLFLFAALTLLLPCTLRAQWSVGLLAGAIDQAAAQGNPNVEFILVPGGIHSTQILNSDCYTPESSQQIQAWINSALDQ